MRVLPTTPARQRRFPGRPRLAWSGGPRQSEAVAVQRWRWPPQALAVAETRPRGPAGRVGAGLGSPGLPRDESRLSRLGRNPPSEPQSHLKTPESSQMVAHRDLDFDKALITAPHVVRNPFPIVAPTSQDP